MLPFPARRFAPRAVPSARRPDASRSSPSKPFFGQSASRSLSRSHSRITHLACSRVLFKVASSRGGCGRASRCRPAPFRAAGPRHGRLGAPAPPLGYEPAPCSFDFAVNAPVKVSPRCDRDHPGEQPRAAGPASAAVERHWSLCQSALLLPSDRLGLVLCSVSRRRQSIPPSFCRSPAPCRRRPRAASGWPASRSGRPGGGRSETL